MFSLLFTWGQGDGRIRIAINAGDEIEQEHSEVFQIAVWDI
jgi:hypothetical protein